MKQIRKKLLAYVKTLPLPYREPVDYYFNKKLDTSAWDIALKNSCVNHDPLLPKKIDWLKGVYNTSIPVVRQLTGSQYTPSGFEVFRDTKKVVEYEWDSKSDIGMIWGFIGRHLSCGVSPDTDIITKFTDFASRFIKKLVKDMMLQPLKFKPLEDWVRSKEGWTANKRLRYLTVIKKQLSGSMPLQGPYKATIKSGEVNFSSDLRVEDGFLTGRSDRYRFYVNPSDPWCGLLTYIQHYIFKDLKCLGEFAHALNSKKLKKRIFRNITRIDTLENLTSFSIDGSAFDSTQHQSLIDAIDNCFWKSYRPRLEQIVDLVKENTGCQLPTKVLTTRIIQAATQEIAQIFMKLQAPKDHMLTEQEKKEYKKAYFLEVCLAERALRNPYAGLVAFYVRGTTYSGNPVRTTLGNTLRSIIYMYFYASEANLFNLDDWKSTTSVQPNCSFWCIASGDDTVAWLKRTQLSELKKSVCKYSTSDKKLEGEHGIGQIIVDQMDSVWWDNEFCSKWFYCRAGGSLKDWVCTRDLKKLFSTKMLYKGDDLFMKLDPSIHAEAIFNGICCEVNSFVVQRICKFRLEFLNRKNPLSLTAPSGDKASRELFKVWYAGRLDKIHSGKFFASESIPEMKESDIDVDYESWVLNKLGFTV